MSTNNTKICLVAIGNTLRSDDGVGVYICKLIEEKNLPAVTIVTTQQPDIAMAEDLSTFDRVIFIDASLNDETISFVPLLLENVRPQSSSHHINAAMLASLVQQLFSSNTQFYICAIGASDFKMGNEISDKAKRNAAEAVLLLTEWIFSIDAE